MDEQQPNRLKDSASPYLRSAAHQPVDWHEWGEEAFASARAEDKPILLDIGAVWCHWCHVIDRESYENPEIAAHDQQALHSGEGGPRRASRRGFALSIRDQRDFRARRLAAHRVSHARRQTVFRRHVFSAGRCHGPPRFQAHPAVRLPKLSRRAAPKWTTRAKALEEAVAKAEMFHGARGEFDPRRRGLA